jgi:hypothetical protein
MDEVVKPYIRSSAITLFLAVKSRQLRVELRVEPASAASKIAVSVSGQGRNTVRDCEVWIVFSVRYPGIPSYTKRCNEIQNVETTKEWCVQISNIAEAAE